MKKIKDVLAGKDFTRWRSAHEHMQQLQSVVGQVLDEYGIAAHSCCVDRIVNGELRLYAVSAAATVPIKQILPTLQQTLNRAGFSVKNIRVLTFKIPE